jgi:hypothetical protein
VKSTGSGRKMFGAAKQIQWSAFWKMLQQDHVPNSFHDIVSEVEIFLAPLTLSISQGNPKPVRWKLSRAMGMNE